MRDDQSIKLRAAGYPELLPRRPATTASDAYHIRGGLVCQQETASESLGKALIAQQPLLVDSPHWSPNAGKDERNRTGRIPLPDGFPTGLRIRAFGDRQHRGFTPWMVWRKPLKNYPGNRSHRTLGSFSSSRLEALWANLRSRPTFTAIDAPRRRVHAKHVSHSHYPVSIAPFPQLMGRRSFHRCMARRPRKHNPEGRFQQAGGLYCDIP